MLNDVVVVEEGKPAELASKLVRRVRLIFKVQALQPLQGTPVARYLFIGAVVFAASLWGGRRTGGAQDV